MQVTIYYLLSIIFDYSLLLLLFTGRYEKCDIILQYDFYDIVEFGDGR
jgi:hypothetical protein